MQITVFMAGFMARFALPVKGGEERSSGNRIHPSDDETRSRVLEIPSPFSRRKIRMAG
jgi:hypothetical protein